VRNLGQPRFEHVNREITQLFRQHTPVIIAHRGTPAGTIPENTADAAHAAFLSGADVVEIDVIASRDGAIYVFHTGTEQVNLGRDVTLEELTAAQIDQLRYRMLGRGGRPRRIERLEEFLSRFRGTKRTFNIDRSWHLWPSLLDELTALDMTDQLLLKCSATDSRALQALAQHETPFPFMLICRSLAEVDAARELRGINLVGVELIATEESGPFLSTEAITALHDRGQFTLANAEVLGEPEHLFAGFDDEVSVSVHPSLGWGRLCDLGIRAIQTDWPWLLHEYRKSRTESMLAHAF
jgi:hypothetical protein